MRKHDCARHSDSASGHSKPSCPACPNSQHPHARPKGQGLPIVPQSSGELVYIILDFPTKRSPTPSQRWIQDSRMVLTTEGRHAFLRPGLKLRPNYIMIAITLLLLSRHASAAPRIIPRQSASIALTPATIGVISAVAGVVVAVCAVVGICYTKRKDRREKEQHREAARQSAHSVELTRLQRTSGVTTIQHFHGPSFHGPSYFHGGGAYGNGASPQFHGQGVRPQFPLPWSGSQNPLLLTGSPVSSQQYLPPLPAAGQSFGRGRVMEIEEI